VSRSERLLALLQSLRNRRAPVTAARLAESFGNPELTVYRDLASLAAQRAGVEVRDSPRLPKSVASRT
jgi:predicted DNA-binding transcriptional regulator YafY